MKSIIERAAGYKSRDRAVRLIEDALHVKATDETLKHVSPRRVWAGLEQWQRCREIGWWLTDECRASMKGLIAVTDPLHTVGTRD